MKDDFPDVLTWSEVKERSTDLIREVRRARLKQLEAKREVKYREREYSFLRAEAYLNANAKGHYEKQAMVAMDDDVSSALKELHDAELEHYRCWVESSYLTMLSGGSVEPENNTNEKEDGQ